MKKPLRVLLVEDSADDALFVLRELERGGFDPAYERVQTLTALEDALEHQIWDLVISDHTLPGFGSLQALETFNQKHLDIPFIVVSGTIGEEVAVKAMKAGANDYVMKNHLARLAPSVERELREAWSRRARRRAEEALLRNEQELNDFFEHASVGLQWIGPDGVILRANQAQLGLLGYSQQEFAGHRISEFCADAGVVEQIFARLHAGEEVRDFDTRWRCKDGSVIYVLIDSNVLRENGKFIHARWFMRDITDRKAAEEASAYLAAIVESSDDAIIGMAPDGRIVSWNGGAQRMYGFTSDEVKDKPIATLMPQYCPEEWELIHARILAGERIDGYTTVRQRKNKTVVDVSLTLSPIKDKKGRVIGASAIERDITARKREEEDRLDLINELTQALGKIKTLSGLLPICSACKKIRDDGGYWRKLEAYISERTDAEFTHGICPDCMARLYPQFKTEKSSPASTTN